MDRLKKKNKNKHFRKKQNPTLEYKISIRNQVPEQGFWPLALICLYVQILAEHSYGHVRNYVLSLRNRAPWFYLKISSAEGIRWTQ